MSQMRLALSTIPWVSPLTALEIIPKPALATVCVLAMVVAQADLKPSHPGPNVCWKLFQPF